jgi:hypothetical protein
VSADLSLNTAATQATLDPDAALALDTVYTVEVTSGVEGKFGSPAVPHTSYFRTDPVGGGEIPLPQVSEGTVPVSTTKSGSGSKTAGEHIGWSVAPAGDLNSDGYDDLITGAPDWGTPTDAEIGEVLVYLGGASDSERVVPDIAYRGEAAYDRAGVAVAGNFDFNNDGTPDILIGAPGADPGGDSEAGKVYLIYFDPSDYNFADSDTDIINLGDVGSTIDGVVFTGASADDLAGYSLAGGGALGWDTDSSDTVDDIVIGAPGVTAFVSGDDGAAYVIFSDGTLGNEESLDDVGGTVAGHKYSGGSLTDQRLGHAIALPGDVTGTAGDDIAIGAPTNGTFDTGMAYVVEGGGIRKGSSDASSIAAQIQGTQPNEQLGFSLAGGGDNRKDEQADLLIGCPFYDAAYATLPNAGRVIQISDRIPASTTSADAVGDTISGVIWEGDADSDGLGYSVAGVGTVTDNNYADIALGAPFADRDGDSDAGTVYLIEGETEHTAMTSPMSVGEVGPSVHGLQLTGVAAGEHAGFAISAAGDLDGDSDGDFGVGAPHRTVGSQTDVGRVYLVLESELEEPGYCDEDGCTVVDLSNGAQLAVPAFSLAGPTVLAVSGILDADGLARQNKHVPAGWTLAGAADYDDENQTFGGPDPTADIPINPDKQDQVAAGPGYELVYQFDEELGWIPLTEGDVIDNQHYPSYNSVELLVDPLHVFAVFLPDADNDGMRNTMDCDSDDGAVFHEPHEIVNVRFPSETVLEWDSDAPNSGTGTVYDVLRGDLDEVAFIGSGSGEICLAFGTSETSIMVDDSSGLASGEGYFYLIRAENTCGVGTYGGDSSFNTRTSATCPHY